MKIFLRISAILEIQAGILLLFFPAVAIGFLLQPSGGEAALTIGRVTGAALMALGIMCWIAARDSGSSAAKGVAAGMLCYNILGAAVLLYGATTLQQTGVGLWPAIVLHGSMALWCGYSLIKK